MRLTNKAREIILRIVHEIFGSHATILLFGSRTDDSARGGDIDLLVQVGKPVPERRRKELQLIARLPIRLGDQPIDVLVIGPETDIQPVHEEALRTGVRLGTSASLCR